MSLLQAVDEHAQRLTCRRASVRPGKPHNLLAGMCDQQMQGPRNA